MTNTDETIPAVQTAPETIPAIPASSTPAPAAPAPLVSTLPQNLSNEVLTLLKVLLATPLQNIIANPTVETVTAQVPGLVGNAIADSPAAQGILIKTTAQYLLDHVNQLAPVA